MKEYSVDEKPYLESRLRQTAFNSSHYVWALTDLKFFESSRGNLFAYQTSRQILFVALEPLPPAGEIVADNEAFAISLAELKAFTKKRTVVFVGVYAPCMEKLAALGFKGLRVGSDPWVQLEVGGPKGNKAKGIRSARNQALRHGVEIEEWSLGDIAADPNRQAQVRRVHELWSESSLFKLSGFLLASDPLMVVEGRRLFVARTAGTVVGFLVTSPVRFGQSSYFEDLMFLPDAPNGCTELLMLHAMEALRLDGQTEVSLGVVALNNFGFYDAAGESALAHLGLKLTKRLAQCFYSSAGIELNRKRYQPRRWDDTFVACAKEDGPVNWLTWAAVLSTIVVMLKPRLHITAPQALHLATRWFKKHRFDFAWSLAIAVFGLQCHYGVTPALIAVLAGYVTLGLIKTHVRGYALGITLTTAFVGAHLMQLPWVMSRFNRGPVHTLDLPMTLAPFWPALFLAGVALQYVSRRKGTLVGLCALLVPLGFGMSVGHPEILAERIFPLLFLAAGFVAGRINFAVYRHQSEKHSKDRPPPKSLPRISL